MGFLDKLKDVGRDVMTGGMNSRMRDSMAENAKMPPLNNPDGTISAEGMAAQQERMRNVMNNNPMAKMMLSDDVRAGFGKTMEDAFARQNVMVDMMKEHQEKKLAEGAHVAETDPPKS